MTCLTSVIWLEKLRGESGEGVELQSAFIHASEHSQPYRLEEQWEVGPLKARAWGDGIYASSRPPVAKNCFRSSEMARERKRRRKIQVA
ncbi:hypothetical protein MHYP_G00021530 [Metynnis hypsauchen]